VAFVSLALALTALIHNIRQDFIHAAFNKPRLSGWVSRIQFCQPGEGPGPAAPPGLEKIAFDVSVTNSGNQNTMLVACWLLKEGASRKEAESLLLHPSRLVIPARGQVSFVAILLHEDIQSYRNLSCTLVLRDATQREYPVLVPSVSPAGFGRAIENAPVRERQ
jgi:hypothetical protein